MGARSLPGAPLRRAFARCTEALSSLRPRPGEAPRGRAALTLVVNGGVLAGRRRSSIGFCPGRRDLGLTISHGARLRHPGDRPGRQQMADMRSSMAGPSCRLGRCSPSGRACAPLPGQRAVRRAQALLEPLDLLLHLQGERSAQKRTFRVGGRVRRPCTGSAPCGAPRPCQRR